MCPPSDGSRSNRWSTTLRKKVQPQNRRRARRKSLLFLPSRKRQRFPLCLLSRLQLNRRSQRFRPSQLQRNHLSHPLLRSLLPPLARRQRPELPLRLEPPQLQRRRNLLLLPRHRKKRRQNLFRSKTN